MDGTGLQLALPGPYLLSQWPWTKERGKETKETPSSSLGNNVVHPEEVKSKSPSGSALGPSRWQNLDWEPY